MIVLTYLFHWFVVTAAIVGACTAYMGWLVVQERRVEAERFDAMVRDLTWDGEDLIYAEKRRGIERPLPKQRRTA